jgi:hypothetical protein
MTYTAGFFEFEPCLVSFFCFAFFFLPIMNCYSYLFIFFFFGIRLSFLYVNIWLGF